MIVFHIVGYTEMFDGILMFNTYHILSELFNEKNANTRFALKII